MMISDFSGYDDSDVSMPPSVSGRGSDSDLLPDITVSDGGSDPDLPPDVIAELEDWKAPSEFNLDFELFLPSDIEELEAADSHESENEPLPKKKRQAVKESRGLEVASPFTVKNWLRAPGVFENLSWGMELYNPPCVLSAAAAAHNPSFGCLSLDILTAWDFGDEHLKSLTLRLCELALIAFLFLSPPCTMLDPTTDLDHKVEHSSDVHGSLSSLCHDPIESWQKIHAGTPVAGILVEAAMSANALGQRRCRCSHVRHVPGWPQVAIWLADKETHKDRY